MLRIRKHLDKSSDYEGMPVRWRHNDRSDKKRTSEFVDEIQIINDNDPSLSIGSISSV